MKFQIPGLIKTSLIILSLMIATGLTACSKQNWYEGARASQTANCMNQPLSEYDDCKQQSDDNYLEYEKKREQLNTENNFRK